MVKVIKKYKTINLILGLLAIIIGLMFFSIIYMDYKKSLDFYNNADVSQGYVFNVRENNDKTFSYEYKYVVNGEEYKNNINSEKREALKEDEIINVYYNEKNPKENVLKKPTKRNIYIAVSFLIVFVLIGLLNIVKYFKK